MKHILLLGLLFLITPGFCQNDSTGTYIDQLYSNWKKTYTKYQYETSNGKKTDADKLLSSDNYDSVKVNSFLAEMKQKESEYYRGDVGLNLNGGFLYNPSGGEQNFDNIIYQSRFITDVGWDILRSGYVHNKVRAQIAENERKIALIEDEELRKNASFAMLWNFVIYQFNLQKIQVLDDRMSLAQNKIEAIKKLYLLNKVDQNELLKHLESLAEIKNMYRVYREFNDRLKEEYGFENRDTLDLPLIDINYDAISEKLRGAENDSIVFYKKENIDLKHKFINEISLRTSVRYSYYDLVTLNPSSRDFVSLGISLGIPLNFNRKTKEEWIDLQKRNVEYLPEEEKATLQKAILTNYYEFRYKLKQYSSMHYKKLMYKELMRKENARYSVDYLSFNPVSSLRIIDDLMKIDIEMIDLKQQMYLKLISIHSDTPYSDIDELYSIHTLEDEFEKVHAADRSVYMWDDIFESQSANFLLNYIEKEDYKRVILSYNKAQKNNEVKRKFIDTLRSKNIKVEIMTGKNSLLGTDPIGYYDTITQSVDFSRINALHLDVEPHTLEDWDVNEKKYLDQYINLLDRTQKYCQNKGLKLSVSIPLHYPKEYIQKIYERCDLVYFMAYENVDTDYIVGKVKDYDREKTIIALRTEDFQNPLEIEIKIIDIQTNYIPLEFVIHDIRRMIALEKK